MSNSRIYFKSESGGTTVVSRDTTANSGNLVLPASGNVASVDTSVTDNAIARYDGTIGKLQNSGVIINDNGDLGVGTYPTAKLSTLTTNNNIAENIFMAGILGVTNGFTVSKDSVANPKYIFHTTSGLAGLEIDSAGNVLLKAGTGALGYGAGAGGTVTQLTSKSTAVTLNKPNGQIILSNSALVAGGIAGFQVNNFLVSQADIILLSLAGEVYIGNYNVWTSFGVNGAFNICVKNISGLTLSEQPVIKFIVIKGSNQ